MDIFESALGLNAENNNDLLTEITYTLLQEILKLRQIIIILFQLLSMALSVVFSKPLISMHFDFSHCNMQLFSHFQIC